MASTTPRTPMGRSLLQEAPMMDIQFFISCIFQTHLGRLSDYIPNSLNIYIYIYIYIYTYIYMHIHIYISTYIYIYSYYKGFLLRGSKNQISQIVVDEYHWIPYAFGKSYKILTTVIFEEHHLLFLNILTFPCSLTPLSITLSRKYVFPHFGIETIQWFVAPSRFTSAGNSILASLNTTQNPPCCWASPVSTWVCLKIVYP